MSEVPREHRQITAELLNQRVLRAAVVNTSTHVKIKKKLLGIYYLYFLKGWL